MANANKLLNAAALVAIALAGTALGVKNAPGNPEDRLINVSYDPTRELYQAINPLFEASYVKSTGRRINVVQSHGGSSTQARKVVDGAQAADVVTLGFFSDVDLLEKRGLIAPGWEDRLPNHSLPYTSTIVFVVRRGNPFHVRDWPDLLKPGLQIVATDPNSSAAGKLTALAAWTSVVARGGSESDARAYLINLYNHIPVLSDAARTATLSFSFQNNGDVQLTWEDEAIQEAAASKGALQIVYPPISFRAEPYVAWLEKSSSGKSDTSVAQSYLKFLFSSAGQQTIARLGYRPYDVSAARKINISFPDIPLVSVAQLGGDWRAVNEKFFVEDGIVASILGARKQ